MARTCPTCISVVEQLLTSATTLLHELTFEATGQATKTPGGWSTGSEGTPAGIRIAPLQASHDLTQAVKALGENIGVRTRKPTVLLPQAYRLAHPAENKANLLYLYSDLGIAVRTAERLVDTQPELILWGWCPECGEPAKAPPDRTHHKCACGQLHDLQALKEQRRDMVYDKLDGSYFNLATTVKALEAWGFKETPVQVSMWGERGKVPREKVNGHWVYLFDEALDQAELKAIKKRRLENKRVALDQAA
ncbi:MAG: hypothetical protein EOM34_17300 [Clostridia bacterium]|nr:hypothetical protein [Clostridia bacterium]